MKIAFTAFVAVASVCVTFAQQLPNPGFENWETRSYGGANLETPTGWSSTNQILVDFGVTDNSLDNVTKSNQTFTGLYAAKIESIDLLGFNRLTGYVAVGKIDPLNQKLTPSLAFTYKPDSLAFYYKYTPAVGNTVTEGTTTQDGFRVIAALTKYANNKRDTLAIINWVETSTVTSFTRKSLPFVYSTIAGVPDSLLLVFSSSKFLDDAVIGSVAYVDEVSFIYNPLVTITTQSLQLTNFGFENWAVKTYSGATYENPENWNSTNDIFPDYGITLGLTNVSKSTDSKTGTYAAKLESIDLFGMGRSTGYVTIGKINPLNQALTPGAAFAQKPDSLAFWYKCNPLAGTLTGGALTQDGFRVIAILSKHNGTKRDTLAKIDWTQTSTITAFTRKSLAFEYTTITGTPDSVLLVFSSSKILDDAIVGSVAYLDDISFLTAVTITGTNTSTGVNTVTSTIGQSDNNVNVYPNPTKGTLNIGGLSGKANVLIYNILGEAVLTKETNDNLAVVQLDHLKSGIYFVKVNEQIFRIIKE